MSYGDLPLTLILSAIAVFVYMTYWYFVSKYMERVDIVDIAWGFGFVFVEFFDVVA